MAGDLSLGQFAFMEVAVNRWKSRMSRGSPAALAGNDDPLFQNLRVDGEIDADTIAKKQTELRDRLASLKLQMDALDRNRDEMADLVSKVFELSQTLREKWLTADYSCKRRILEIICLNFSLDDVSLGYEMRKPFDVLVEGLPVQWSRADRI